MFTPKGSIVTLLIIVFIINCLIVALYGVGAYLLAFFAELCMYGATSILDVTNSKKDD